MAYGSTRSVPRLAALVLPFALAGCHPAFFGNLAVLGLAVGIFVATLSLGRSSGTTQADGSTATRSTAHRS